MQGKVEICGVNMAALPALKNAETKELLRHCREDDRSAREQLSKPALPVYNDVDVPRMKPDLKVSIYPTRISGTEINRSGSPKQVGAELRQRTKSKSVCAIIAQTGFNVCDGFTESVKPSFLVKQHASVGEVGFEPR